MATRHLLEREQRFRRPLAEVFAFFADAGNLDRIFRPALRFLLVAPVPLEKMRAGALIDYRMRLYGVPFRWRTLIEEWEPGVRFVDSQDRGPYDFWRHTHEFREHGGVTVMRDRVEYALPLGAIGELAHALAVKPTLARLFARRWVEAERRFA